MLSPLPPLQPPATQPKGTQCEEVLKWIIHSGPGSGSSLTVMEEGGVEGQKKRKKNKFMYFL